MLPHSSCGPRTCGNAHDSIHARHTWISAVSAVHSPDLQTMLALNCGTQVPHPAARQPVSRHSLDYCAFRDSSGSSGCMVSSSDLGGDGSGGRGVGDRRAWSGTSQPAALADRGAVTATRPRSGGRASAWRRLAGAAVPGLWRPGAGLRPARGGWSRPAQNTSASHATRAIVPAGGIEDGSKGGSCHVSSSVRQHRGRWGRHRPGPARSSATSSWPRKSRTCWVRSPARAAWAVHCTTTWWALWELFASP